jgi:hypothetical protein
MMGTLIFYLTLYSKPIYKRIINVSQKNTCKGLFITGFDGTLLRSDGTFSQEDLDALETLVQHGVKTAIATGRSLYSFNSSPGRFLSLGFLPGEGPVLADSSYML